MLQRAALWIAAGIGTGFAALMLATLTATKWLQQTRAQNLQGRRR